MIFSIPAPSQFLKKAKEMLVNEEDTFLKHIALELRFCIEAITYEKLDFFKEYLPESVKRTWQPDKFFRLLERLEPGATATYSISIGKEETPDVSSKNLISMGEHKTFDIKWLSKNYNKLGHYLHVQGKEVEGKKLREDLIKIIEELNKIINSPIQQASFASRISLSCKSCGEKIPINVDAIYDPFGKRNVLKEVECLNEKCGVINDIKQDEQGKLSLVITPYLLNCDCGHAVSLRREDLKIGYRIKCLKCEKQYYVAAFRMDSL